MSKAGFFRAYTIERDGDGLPVRMVWAGDYRQETVMHATCTHCGSQRIRDGHCWDCWYPEFSLVVATQA